MTSDQNQQPSYDSIKKELEKIQAELQSGSVPIGEIQNRVKRAGELYQQADDYLKATLGEIEKVINTQASSIPQ